MRRVKLFVAMSLDGFIAGPNEEIDWLFTDQDYGFAKFYKSVDTVLIGRKTYDFMLRHSEKSYKGKRNYVFSRSQKVSKHPDVKYVSQDPAKFVRSLRLSRGRDIWLVGGAGLFASLLKRSQVDDIILAVHPVVLGKGIALFPGRSNTVQLKLVSHTNYKTGLVVLHYRAMSKAAKSEDVSNQARRIR
jgi:dihydrofolate reductase